MVIKTFFKILKVALLSFLSVILLCLILIYIPPIQQIIFNKITSSLKDRIGYDISAEDFYITFPINIHVQNLLVLDFKNTPLDSSALLDVKKVYANISISNLHLQEIKVNELELSCLNVNFKQDSSNIIFKTQLDTLSLQALLNGFDPILIKIQNLFISDSDIALNIDNKYNTLDSERNTEPIELRIEWDSIVLHKIQYTMSGNGIPSIVTNFDNLLIKDGNYILRNGLVLANKIKLNNGNINIDKVKSDSTFKLQANNIVLEVDSVYNKGDVIRGNFKKLSFNHPSGLEVKDGGANSKLDSTSTDLSLFFLQTANSLLKVNINAKDKYTNLPSEYPLYLDVDACIGFKDIIPFYSHFPDTLLNDQIKILGKCELSSNNIDISFLSISIDKKMELYCKGSIQDYEELENTNGSINVKGYFKDMSCFKKIFGDNYIIPDNTRFTSDFNVYRGIWGGEIDLKENETSSSFKILFLVSPSNSDYSANLIFKQFDISSFLPNYGLGKIDGTTTLVLHYPLAVDSMSSSLASTSPSLFNMSSSLDSMRFNVESKLNTIVYNNYSYNNINFDLNLLKGKYNFTIDSKDVNANLDLNASGIIDEDHFLLDWKGEIKKIDLLETNFSTTYLAFASKLMGHFEMGEKINMYTTFAKFRIDDEYGFHKLGALMFNARGDDNYFNTDFFSGDFRINVNSKTSLNNLIGRLSNSFEILSLQLSHKTINLKHVFKDFPKTVLNIKGGQRNLLGDFMASYGIGMKNIKGDISVSEEDIPFKFNLAINRIYYNDIVLDSLIVNSKQMDSSFMYNIGLFSTVKNGGIDSKLKLFGEIKKNALSFYVERLGENKKTAFYMGANIKVKEDSSYNIELFPLVPIISYKEWNLNKDNFININKHQKIKANIILKNNSQSEFLCNSLPDKGDRINRLKVRLSEIVLDSLSNFLNFLPPMSGNLSSDINLYSVKDSLFTNAALLLDDLYYNKEKVGNIYLDAKYYSYKNFRNLNTLISINDTNSIRFKGNLMDSKVLSADLKISDFSLETLNPFLPDGSISLFGTMDSDIAAKGNIDTPLIDGYLEFRNASLFLDLLGSNYDIESSPFTFHKNKLEIDKLLLRASDKSEMLLSGNVDFLNLDKIYTSLNIKADNFQLVNVKENPASTISGKAYIDMNGRVRGDFSNLNISGRVKMLNSSNIVYTMHDTELQIVDKTENLISFVPFRDSSFQSDRLMVRKEVSSAYKMTTLISIGNKVNVKLNLAEKGDNNILIQGGGYLLFSMNPENGPALSGKYTINDGMVNYNVPLAGKQTFNIIKGSNVQWTGNILNPLLNISAAENVRASVSSGDNEKKRIVSMNAIINIGNNLNNPDISFNIDTPNDMVIKNELNQLNSEERAKKAMNLIIYKSYSGIDESSSKTMTDMASNSLYSFVENELNRYTARTGFTFGIDTYSNTGTDNGQKSRTDYSYKYTQKLFNNKIDVSVGGRVSTNDNSESSSSLENTIVDDLSIEYMLNRRKNLYLKVFRYTNYENVLEGDITSTGLGIVFKRSFSKFNRLFKSRKNNIDEDNEFEED